MKIPKFQLQRVYEDGSRSEPELHSLDGIDTSCRMGRRGFLLTSALGAGTLAALSGCAAFKEGWDVLTDLASGGDGKSGGSDGIPRTKEDLPPLLEWPEKIISATVLKDAKAHSADIQSLAFALDGKTLVSGASDKTVKFWSIPAGKLLHATTLDNKVQSLAYASDGKSLYLYLDNGHLIRWASPFKGRRGTLFKSSDAQGRAVLSPDGKALVTVPLIGDVLYRSLPGGAVSWKKRGNFSRSAFSPDGKSLAVTGNVMKETVLYDAASGDLIRTWPTGGPHLSFSPDGQQIAVRGRDVLCLLPLPAEGETSCMRLSTSNNYPPVAFSPDGRWLATETHHTANLHGIMLFSPPFARPDFVLQGHNGDLRDLAFSADSRYLACGTNSGQILVWELHDGKDPKLVAALFDTGVINKNVSMRQATTSEKSVYVGRCGDPLPHGAVCTCNCVPGTYSGPAGKTICTCNTVTTCTCNTVPVCTCNTVPTTAPRRSSGGGYCSCNRICTCVPIK